MKKLNRLSMIVMALTMTSSAFAADKVTFQLDWLPGGDKAPVYVGIQEGFFSALELDVKIASGRGSTDAITKLATGQSDVGSSDIGALMAARAQDNVPVSAVMSYFTEAPHAFYVLADSGINSIKDLQGKKISTSPFTSSNAFLPLVLKQNNVPVDSVKLSKVDPGALGPMLMVGNTQAIIAWVTNTALFEQQAAQTGKKIKVLPWSEGGLSLYSSALLASDKFLASRPEVAKRFIKAYAQSVQFTYQHPDKAGQDLHNMVPEVDADIVSAQISSIHDLVFNKISQQDGFGMLTPTRIATTWKYVAQANDLRLDSLNPESVVNRAFIPSHE
ncbi:ABC transporter substrate-binding protein [Marinomonas pollencensis]|uniref:NitT/TauT family transport system substrate-binding protein n=1 Tax=Marinomonas pollencensis TaxID=491954 RepID=A0A3E0DLU5_9GAMM|nr:ABC transporter substrate-binding protein [Marinomonas pollencensis]REG83778.1 NitT/TauT family transport system substrate-binding protein [Marinomonas pollencensis]